MKNTKFSSDRLILSMMYRTFTEWLRRNGYSEKFMANLSNPYLQSHSPQYTLRSILFNIMNSRKRSFRDIFDSAFVFAFTPEGTEYWKRVTSEWCDFLDNLEVQL